MISRVVVHVTFYTKLTQVFCAQKFGFFFHNHGIFVIPLEFLDDARLAVHDCCENNRQCSKSAPVGVGVLGSLYGVGCVGHLDGVYTVFDKEKSKICLDLRPVIKMTSTGRKTHVRLLSAPGGDLVA